MPILVVERRELEARMSYLRKRAKRLTYLYELIEWGGLIDEQWEELHGLEYELGLTDKVLFGACTHCD